MSDIVFAPRNAFSHKPNLKSIYDCAIIGTGVVGYASAMYGARLGMKIILIGEMPGGTLGLTGTVENYPGFVSIDGQKLVQLLENHAMDYDVDTMTEIVDSISRDKKSGLFLLQAGSDAIKAKTVILATGGNVRKLGVKGEEFFKGKGVDYCALCDAQHVKGKVAAIAGGGDSAVKEAILLSEYAKKVYIINNESKLHPEEANSKKLAMLLKTGKIEAINNNEIVEIKGKTSLERVVLKKQFNGSTELKLDGLYIYIGSIPNSSLGKMVGTKLNAKGEVIINNHAETSVPGFFAAGDVTDLEWKQAIIGVSQGVTAAYYASRYLIKNS